MRFHYYFRGTAAAGTFFLYLVAIIGKYAAGAGDLSVCTEVLVLGADKPVIGKFFSCVLAEREKGAERNYRKKQAGPSHCSCLYNFCFRNRCMDILVFSQSTTKPNEYIIKSELLHLKWIHLETEYQERKHY